MIHVKFPRGEWFDEMKLYAQSIGCCEIHVSGPSVEVITVDKEI